MYNIPEDPFIWVKDHDLEPDFCNHVIDKFEKEKRKSPGTTGNRIDRTVKRSTDFRITFSDKKWNDEAKIFHNTLGVDIQEYSKYLLDIMPDNYVNISQQITDSGYQIQRTDPGDFYTWHSDAMASVQLGVRLFTYIWYLNDVEVDGYTEFFRKVKIQPKRGRLLMFPASWDYIHRGYPPKHETKYIVTGWLHDKSILSA
jgi:hypothetical protein